jgi:hypothetical protein
MHNSQSLESEPPPPATAGSGNYVRYLSKIRYQTLNLRCRLLATQISASFIILSAC